MGLNNDINTAKVDAAKLESAAQGDVSKVKAEVVKLEGEAKSLFSKTFNFKVLALVAIAALVVGFIVGKL